METLNTTETDESDILIQNKTPVSNEWNPTSISHLIIYLIGIMIIFGMLALLIQSLINPTSSNKGWIKTVKFNHQNDHYYRHPKY